MREKQQKKFYGAKELTKIWHVNIGGKVISILIEKKSSSNYLNEYLDDVMRPLILILPKVTGYVKTFKD